MTGAALILSIVALLTNAWFAWLRWPRIAVEVSKRIYGTAHLHVTVTLSASGIVTDSRGEVVSRAATESPPAPVANDVTNDPSNEPPQDTFVLTVINNGSDAVTIKTIGFQPVGTPRERPLDFLSTWARPGQKVLPTTGGQEALLPARIEGHDCRIFEYAEEALTSLPAGVYQGYAERYKSFRIWPKCNRSTVRAAVSKGRPLHRRCAPPGT